MAKEGLGVTRCIGEGLNWNKLEKLHKIYLPPPPPPLTKSFTTFYINVCLIEINLQHTLTHILLFPRYPDGADN